MANALAVGVEPGARREVGDDDAPLALEPLGREGEEWRAGAVGLLACAPPGGGGASASGETEASVEGEFRSCLSVTRSNRRFEDSCVDAPGDASWFGTALSM
jgi:hypothetical protein